MSDTDWYRKMLNIINESTNDAVHDDFKTGNPQIDAVVADVIKMYDDEVGVESFSYDEDEFYIDDDSLSEVISDYLRNPGNVAKVDALPFGGPVSLPRFGESFHVQQEAENSKKPEPPTPPDRMDMRYGRPDFMATHENAVEEYQDNLYAWRKKRIEEALRAAKYDIDG